MALAAAFVAQRHGALARALYQDLTRGVNLPTTLVRHRRAGKTTAARTSNARTAATLLNSAVARRHPLVRALLKVSGRDAAVDSASMTEMQPLLC